MPRVGALDVRALARLDRHLLTLVRDATVQTARGEFGTGLGRVEAGVQAHGDAAYLRELQATSSRRS